MTFAHRIGIIASALQPPIPQFVGAGAMSAEDTSAPVSPELPSGWTINDVSFLLMWTNGSNTFPTPPGWNVVNSDESNSSMSCKSFWRRMQSGDSSPSFTTDGGTSISSSNGLFARIWAFRGCLATGDPFELNQMVWSNTSTPYIIGDVDTTGPNRLVAGLCALDNDPTLSSFPPSGWTEAGAYVTTITAADAGSMGMMKEVPDAGTIGTSVGFGGLSATTYFHSQRLALIPAGG